MTLALVWFAALLAPRMIGSVEQPRRGDVVIGIVSANVHQGAANAGALVDLVESHHADLLAVAELTQSFDRRLRRAGILRRLPHTALSKGSGAAAAGIYSSFPLMRLPESDPACSGCHGRGSNFPGDGRSGWWLSTRCRLVATRPIAGAGV